MQQLRRIAGRPASSGQARGRPVVVMSEDDLDLVAYGDVLVAAQTDIAYVPAMHRASAIVTEAGGRFCHAAVWARENDKPTLLQVEDAMSLLTSVASVVVDADEGFIEWGET
jgi:pyruvate, water dikinase